MLTAARPAAPVAASTFGAFPSTTLRGELTVDDLRSRLEAFAEVATCFERMGDLAQCEWYLQQALRWARELDDAEALLETLCDLAHAACALGRDLAAKGQPEESRVALERSRDHCFEGVRLAAAVADRRLQAAVLMRLAMVLELCGDHADARALQQTGLELVGDDTPTVMMS
jgi:hypothetical protein